MDAFTLRNYKILALHIHIKLLLLESKFSDLTF